MSYLSAIINKTGGSHTWTSLSIGWPVSFTIILCLWLTISIAYYRCFHQLSRFPGPFLASFTNLWKVYHVYVGDLEHVLLSVHRKHGKIVRIGPNHLDFSDASAVKSIYGSGRAFPKRCSIVTTPALYLC